MAGLKPCPCTSHEEHREGLHGTDPCQEEGRQGSSPGSPVAHCSISAPQNHHQPLCSTGTNGVASPLCMRDFSSWLDVPDIHQPLIQLRMLLTSTFHVWAPCPALQLSVTAMPFPLPSFSLGSKNCISAMLQLDPFDLSLSCGCPDKSEGAQQRWAASSHRSESQSSCLLAPFHLLNACSPAVPAPALKVNFMFSLPVLSADHPHCRPHHSTLDDPFSLPLVDSGCATWLTPHCPSEPLSTLLRL